MEAISTVKDKARVIMLSGAIDFSSRKALRTMIEEGLEQGGRNFILHLQDVISIDSSGLGALIACFSMVRKHGGDMKLVRVPQQVRDLMEMTRLSHFFDVFDSEEEAMRP